jgi:hypothetical protein
MAKATTMPRRRKSQITSNDESKRELEIEDRPQKFHQDMLRSLNLHDVLSEALKMDYNLAFKGSICTLVEKDESRNIILSSQRCLFEIMILFVENNVENQKLLMKHLSVRSRCFF